MRQRLVRISRASMCLRQAGWLSRKAASVDCQALVGMADDVRLRARVEGRAEG